MNETTGKRIAFVVNARTGDELQAGNRDPDVAGQPP